MPDPAVCASTAQAAALQASRHSGQPVRFEQSASFNALLGAARFRLDNGLRIVVMPDRRAPLFAYQTWFKVGSRDEHPDHTGMAHFLEHLMFRGTAAHPAGEFDTEMELRGAQTNAATWLDWTFYTAALANRHDNLERLVEYEVDRMVNLRLDEETFGVELEVVKNERRMAIDDSVTGTLGERLFSLAFQQHPYRWPTLGTMAHLEAMTLPDVQAFYRRFYAPNNAVVVVVGDLDLTATLTLLAERYGPLPAQPSAPRDYPSEPRQTAARHDVIQRPVIAPQLLVAYHAPAQLTADYLALEMLHDALAVGDSARLYRRLVTEEALLSDIEGSMSPFADPGLYDIGATLRTGVSPERVLAVLGEELGRISDGLTPRELNKATHDVELGLISSLRDAESCAESLGHYEVNYNDFGEAFTGIERLATITPSDLCRVAREVFRPDNQTTVLATLEPR